MKFKTFTQSVQGASHIKKNIPCQDFSIVDGCEKYKIFVLGDGHGNRNCFRSQVGSRLLCEIAHKNFITFAENIESEKVLSEYESEPVVRQLIRSIIGTWVIAVTDDCDNNPPSDEELASAREYEDAYRNGMYLEHIYGTTFIGGIITDEYLLLIQQGDGRCVVFDKDGNPSQPVPWDDRCFANITTSVCDNDAVTGCRYTVIDVKNNPVAAVIAGSDGVEDSFVSMDKMHTFYSDLLIYSCENGIDAFTDYLGPLLSDLNTNGSGDDTTVCGFIDTEAVSSLFETFRFRKEKVNLDSKIEYLNGRINSMQGKYDYYVSKIKELSDSLNMYTESYLYYIYEAFCSLVSWTMPDDVESVSFDGGNCSCKDADLKNLLKNIHSFSRYEEKLIYNVTQAAEDYESEQELNEETNKYDIALQKYNDEIFSLSSDFLSYSIFCKKDGFIIKNENLSPEEHLDKVRTAVYFIEGAAEQLESALFSDEFSCENFSSFAEENSERDKKQLEDIVRLISKINSQKKSITRYESEFSSYQDIRSQIIAQRDSAVADRIKAESEYKNNISSKTAGENI